MWGIFEKLCIKTAFFFCTLKAIIRGSLCSGRDHVPTLFPFYLLADQQGGMAPCAPPPPLAKKTEFWYSSHCPNNLTYCKAITAGREY